MSVLHCHYMYPPLRSSLCSMTSTYLSVSFLPAVFFRFGAGILHSMEKATQLVHGTPRLAASQRTCIGLRVLDVVSFNISFNILQIIPSWRDTSVRVVSYILAPDPYPTSLGRNAPHMLAKLSVGGSWGVQAAGLWARYLLRSLQSWGESVVGLGRWD